MSAAAEQAMIRRITDHSFGAFADTAAAVNNCARPIRLVGHSDTIDPATVEIVGTFSSAETPLGLLYRPCGSGRADICLSCSRTYARDTFAMIKAGVVATPPWPPSSSSDTTGASPVPAAVEAGRVDRCTGGAGGRPSKALTPEQVDAVLAHTKPDRMYGYIALSILTGARTEELRGLRGTTSSQVRPVIQTGALAMDARFGHSDA